MDQPLQLVIAAVFPIIGIILALFLLCVSCRNNVSGKSSGMQTYKWAMSCRMSEDIFWRLQGNRKQNQMKHKQSDYMRKKLLIWGFTEIKLIFLRKYLVLVGVILMLRNAKYLKSHHFKTNGGVSVENVDIFLLEHH